MSFWRRSVPTPPGTHHSGERPAIGRRDEEDDAGAEPATCPNMKTCEMFGLFSLAGALSAWKTNYCSADYTRCERYQRARAGRPVPSNLMPNGALLRKWTPGQGSK